jgi:hypothetical protein
MKRAIFEKVERRMERVEGGSEGLLPPAFALSMRALECGGGMEAYFRVISYNEGIDE